MERDPDQDTHAHTEQLSLVFQGRTDPTRTPWVSGSRAKRGRKGKVIGRKEGRKDRVSEHETRWKFELD